MHFICVKITIVEHVIPKLFVYFVQGELVYMCVYSVGSVMSWKNT